jgi:hypothetical protein
VGERGKFVRSHHPSYSGNINRRTVVQASSGVNVSKSVKSKRAGDVAEVIEHLPSKCKTNNLLSNKTPMN